MPIFQDPEAQGREYSCWSPALPLRRPTTPQQQHLQQHLQHQQRHEQPDLADEEDDEMILDQSSADQNMETACHGPPTSSREELIRRIKDGQSPTWIPNRAKQLEEYFATHGDSPLERLEEKKRNGSPLLPSVELERSPGPGGPQLQVLWLSRSASGKNIADDSPSPYVGFIDLENSLPAESRPAAKKPKKQVAPRKCPCHPPEEIPSSSDISLSPRGELRAREKRSRRSQSPKSPPGGCYRIPQQGQLQIIIKNPNKTAVKLFLVPYDLEGMEPGTKTFIRQRSYSTGPAVDIPQASATATPDSQDKPVLRYLIHINICCPSRGRFYLYSGIRAVFANRVPDGKEKLRNELQYPEPRFSTYKLSKESARFAAEKAQQHRRRSSDAPSTSPRSKMAPFTPFTPRPAQDVQQQQQQQQQQPRQEQSIPLPPIQNLQLPPLSNSRPSSRSSNAESLLSLKLRDLSESSPPSP
ncbi:hypothetical protein TEQG_08355 [Trichophyton equinum CBS 127.97]|uniref:Atos-like C-terminal domain-containing protein n=1 Tax=Trichophyton equinum (strain ATCC MYA-4606 / CBS 127.97) TaxID=559882 RepID=F2Q5F0_TRIEC|nr:hypothetical protein TEQG_08355 [Trichophyton equinum CBS 127.97]